MKRAVPEVPDFDQIAEKMFDAMGRNRKERIEHYARRLREIWNARGAADIATVEAELPGASTQELGRALRSLDR
jgi:hypothetical protein